MITRRTFDLLFQQVSATLTGGTSPAYNTTRTGRITSMTVYSGTQPTAQTIENNWTNYNQSSGSCLVHYSTGPTWSFNTPTRTYYFTNVSNSITATALNSGTASWAIIWNGTGVNINTTVLPNNGRFVVVPVTLNNSTGIIRYTSLTTTSGQAFLPYDGGLSIVEA
jgi:hypothetical protein